jgi:RHS repeat-associated protein
MTGSASARWRPRWWFVPAVIVVVGSLVAGLVVGLQLFRGWGASPVSSAGSAVPVHVVKDRPVRVPVMHPYDAGRVSWPAAAAGTAVIGPVAVRATAVPLTAGPSAGSARAGDLPVWVGPPDGTAPVKTGGEPVTTAYTGMAVSRVRVGMGSRATASALGVHGVVFSMAPAGGAGGPVHVSVSYSSFADAYGGGYASRLHLVELPTCALTTPEVASCRVQTPVPSGSVDDVHTSQVGADVTLPGPGTAAVVRAGQTMLTADVLPDAGALSGAVVLAVTASASGSGGNYAVPPLSEMNEWVSAGSSGAYMYSYPMTVPPVPGGLEPTVELDYDSQMVDGITSATNPQASWVGDGWDYSTGFVEEDYPACSSVYDTSSDSGLDAPDTSDLCADDGATYLTLSMDGVSTTLVDSKGVWHAEADQGYKVQQVTDSGTGQSYWEVTETDGTSYYFGMDQLPGYSSGDAQTGSLLTVPVWMPDAGQFGGPAFAETPWRWNLDYVTDTHGDAIAYFYNDQANYYAEDDGTTGTGQYVQDATLSKIEYGLRSGDIHGYTPAAQVNFTVTAGRQDAPADLACTVGAACSVTAPTFWNNDALTGISTQADVNGSLQNVDSWALSDVYPATGDPTTAPSLWLSSITRTGQDGATPVTLPPTSFAGTPMPNRVMTAADTAAGYSLMTRFRLSSITNETGGVTTIAYGSPAGCTAGDFPVPDANTTTCYPSYWTPGGGSSPVEDWFSTYAVTSVTQTDTTGGDPPVVTTYTYVGPAWHFEDDTVSRSVTTTWDEWRGFHTVTTETGTEPDPVTETVDTYFQGMSLDETSSGCLQYPCGSTVTLTSSHGQTATDSDGDAGMVFESIVYDGAGTGNEVTDTINDVSTATTGTDSALPYGLSSYMAEPTGTITYTTLAGGGTRESTVTDSDDQYGRATQEIDVPDTSNPAESTCTLTSYNTYTTTNVMDQVASVQVITPYEGACTVNSASQAVSSTEYTYDAAGDITKTQQATSATAVTELGSVVLNWAYQTTNTSTYDEYGRILTSTDGDNRTTTTAYTPAASAEPTSVAVTDPAGLVTTDTYDPARDLLLTDTNPAGYVASTSYDALGRPVSEWTPGNPASGPATTTYSYTVSNTAPSVTTEEDEEPGGNYLTTQTLDDSSGIVREVQQETAGGGTDVTDTTYNSDGWQALVSGPYYVSGAPSGTLVGAASSSVPSQTGYLYDGDGRVIRQISYTDGNETWETDTAYTGNSVTVTPPSGGTAETTWTDGRGLTTAIWQYHAGAPVSTSDPSSDYDATSYVYTPALQLATITDADGNTWSYTYNLLGEQLTASDPDAGTSTSTYDGAGQLMTVTDARGKTTSYTYDQDGRETAEYDTTGGALESSSDELASWTYDTLAKGQLTSSTAYEGGAQYTEEVTGYNSQELPAGTETIIPSAQGALAGTYTQTYTYAPDGQETSYTDAAAGGLAAETVTTGYDSAGDPDSLTGASSYVDSLSYTDLDQPLQYTMGSSSEPVYVTDSYDPQTQDLTDQNTQTGTAETSVDDLTYTYNDVQDITSEADIPSGDPSATDVQCFQYDYLNRLVQAWAQGTAGCALPPSASGEGGAAPYWDTYSYNVIGDLTGITSTTPAGAVTTTSDTYPAAGAAHPHAITGQAVTTSAGTTDTTYGYDPDGDLTSVTGTSQDQALTWNDAGWLTQDAVTPAGGSAQDTGYIYDADGDLLLTADPGTTTLYLSDEELSENTSTGTVTGTRYYTLDGASVATLTGASSVAYIIGDQQGTASLAISASTLALTRRYYDPYGNTIGTPATNFPTGEKGFIGGASDPATGLTDLGAREYQPATGSFISTDSLLKPYDPQDLNAYTYAADNPTTLSDPTGQMGVRGAGESGSMASATSSQSNEPQNVKNNVTDTAPPRNTTSTATDYCTAAASECDLSAINKSHAKHGPARHHPSFWDRLGDWAKNQAVDVLLKVFAIEQNPSKDAEAIGNWLAPSPDGCSPDEPWEEPGDLDLSFSAHTLVLLASGKAIPISQLKVGDKVLATNTKTGKTQPEAIYAVLVHHDTDLYNLRVRTGNRTAVIYTTANHLFWDPYQHQWMTSNKLSKGEHLKTPDGATVTVVGGTTPKQHDGWMWDLAVPGNNDHDFYVAAGTSGILVHNETCPSLPSQSGKDATAVIGKLGDTSVAASWDGHEVLNLSDFSDTQNEKWIEGIIQKRQAVYLSSEINDATLAGLRDGDQSRYAAEINQLLKAGYTFTKDGQYMIPEK